VQGFLHPFGNFTCTCLAKFIAPTYGIVLYIFNFTHGFLTKKLANKNDPPANFSNTPGPPFPSNSPHNKPSKTFAFTHFDSKHHEVVRTKAHP